MLGLALEGDILIGTYGWSKELNNPLNEVPQVEEDIKHLCLLSPVYSLVLACIDTIIDLIIHIDTKGCQTDSYGPSKGNDPYKPVHMLIAWLHEYKGK